MKKLKSFDDFIAENYSNKVFEARINPPQGGFKKMDIENLLRKHKDIELHVETDKGDERYFITPYMHVNGKVEGSTDTKLMTVNQKGKEAEIEYSSIRYIQA